MDNDYEILAQDDTFRINEAGEPEEVVKVTFRFDKNRRGVVYVRRVDFLTADVKGLIVEYIEASRRF